VLFFNWATCHEGILEEWRYSSMHPLTLALDGIECSASHPGHFAPGERATGTHWIGSWVDWPTNWSSNIRPILYEYLWMLFFSISFSFSRHIQEFLNKQMPTASVLKVIVISVSVNYFQLPLWKRIFFFIPSVCYLFTDEAHIIWAVDVIRYSPFIIYHTCFAKRKKESHASR